jgi:tetratricopeptide (TPR) repeat protein
MKQIFIKIYFVFSILLIFNFLKPSTLFGQKIDSLNNLLKTLPKSDTNRVNVLNELAFILRNTELARAKSHAEEALLLSKLIRYERGEEESLGYLGLIFYRMGEYEAALLKHLESLKISEKRDNKKAIGFRYNDIANIYNEQGHFQKALEYHFKSLLLKETINDFEGIATSYNNISYCYFNLKEYNKSLEYALKAQELSKEKNFIRVLAISYGRLGEIHFSNEEYDKALKCYFKAYELRRSVKDYHGITGSLHSIAKTYQQTGDLGKALAYYHQALDTSAAHGIKLQMQKSYLGLAEVQVLMNNHVKAYDFYQRYAAIKDSIFNEKAHEQIAKMQALFEAEKNKAQIELLTKDAQLQEDKIKIQNTIINSVVAVTSFFIIFSVVLYRCIG